MEYQESGYIDKLRRIYFGPSSSSSSCAGSSSAASSEAEVKLTAANAAGMLLHLLLTINIASRLQFLTAKSRDLSVLQLVARAS